MPSVTFGLLQAEIFPWALIYSFFVGAIKSKFLWVMLSFALLHAILIGLLFQQFSLFDWLTVWGSYLNAILVFKMLLRADMRLILRMQRAAHFVFGLSIVIGCAQFSGLFEFLDSLIKFFVPRAQFSEIGYGRGVTIFSTEPSRASIELLFLYMVVRVSLTNGSSKPFILAYDFMLFMFVALIMKSITGISCALLFFAIANKSYRYFLVISLVAFSFLAVTYESRYIQLLSSLLASKDLEAIFSILVDSSGFRFSSVISAYYSIFDSVIGYGAGNYANSSLVAFEFSGFNPDSISYFRNRGGEFLSVRPPAFAANVILDFGVFGLIFCIYWLRRLFSSLQASCYPLASAFLLVVFINGSVGNPVVWLCFAVILRLDHEKKSNGSISKAAG